MAKAIIFDIDGVLLDSKEANTVFFQNLLVHAGYKRPSKKSYDKIFHKSMLEVIKVLTRARPEEIERVWKLGHKFPYPSNLVKMPDGSKKVVETLSRQYKLALVTSRIKIGVKNFYKISGTERYFETYVSYEDTKKHKPHPEPLILAAKRLKVKPEESVYVGDSKYDVDAAKAAGMKVVIYSKKRIRGADKLTKSFRDIPKLIREL